MAKSATRNQQVLDALRAHALGYPGAFEDHPWGDTVFKVGKKIFLFLGESDGSVGASVKLPRSHEAALMLDGVEPTGYGLGKAGWVTARFPAGDEVPLPLLREWIDESYRSIAPRTLVKQLDGAAPAKTAPASKAIKTKKAAHSKNS